jgi:flagellar biosynthesis/type III secretory pathway M-ring protein FliF/YscJ
MNQVRQFGSTVLGMSRGAQASILVVAGITVFVLVLVFRAAGAPDWVRIQTQTLNNQQAGKGVSALNEDGIPARVGADGTSIEVGKQQVSEAIGVLAKANIAARPTCGEKVESTTSFSQTSEQIRQASVACMQNELAISIEQLDSSIRHATVTLNKPDERLFTNEQKPMTASVVLSANGDVDKDTVTAIQDIVAFGAGVDADKIRISSNGRSLTRPGSRGGAGDAMTEATLKLQIQEMRNAEIESKLQTMFEEIAGTGKVKVISNVDLDMDQIRREVKDFGGADNAQGPVGLQKNGVETLNRDGAITSGTVGTTANAANDTTIAGGDDDADTNSYLADNGAITYNNDEVVEAINVAVGAEKANRLSILVDDTVPAATYNGIKDAASTFKGTNPSDTFSISRIPFKQSDDVSGAAAGRRAMLAGYIKWLVAGLGLLGMAFLLRRQLNQRTEELLVPVEQPLKQLEQGAFDPMPLAELEAAVRAATSMDNQKRLELQRNVESIAREKPGDVAQQVRGWLGEGNDQYGFSGSSRAGAR